MKEGRKEGREERRKVEREDGLREERKEGKGDRNHLHHAVYPSFPSGFASRRQRVGCLFGRTRTFSTNCHRESGDGGMTPDYGRGRGRGRRGSGGKKRRRRRERRQWRSETHHRHLASRGQVIF